MRKCRASPWRREGTRCLTASTRGAKDEIVIQTMELLTRREAAAFLRISLRKLDSLAADGSIPFSKIGSSERARVVYDKTDLEAYVRRQRIDVAAIARQVTGDRFISG